LNGQTHIEPADTDSLQGVAVPLMKRLQARFSGPILKVAVCLAVAGIIAIGYAVDRHKTLYHFRTVDPGKLYRSGTLSRRGLEKVYSMTGVKTIINLRSESEMSDGSWYSREKEFAAEKGIHLLDLPMLPDTPPSPDQVRQFLDVVTDPERLPALIHCEMGIIRTGMMVAVYKVYVLNEESRKVLAELPMFGRTLDDRLAVKEFIVNFTPNSGSGPAPLETSQDGS
jgi:protein tyrosine/serine phosphatase